MPTMAELVQQDKAFLLKEFKVCLQGLVERTLQRMEPEVRREARVEMNLLLCTYDGWGRPPDGLIKQTGLDPRNGNGPVHDWFGLTYAGYLVVPRLILQELPYDWQRRFVGLMVEANDLHKAPDPKGTSIVCWKGPNGKYTKAKHWSRYRRGTVAEAVAADHE